jgi:hypothetical protein
MTTIDDFQFPIKKWMERMGHANPIRLTVEKVCITQGFRTGPLTSFYPGTNYWRSSRR